MGNPILSNRNLIIILNILIFYSCSQKNPSENNYAKTKKLEDSTNISEQSSEKPQPCVMEVKYTGQGSRVFILSVGHNKTYNLLVSGRWSLYPSGGTGCVSVNGDVYPNGHQRYGFIDIYDDKDQLKKAIPLDGNVITLNTPNTKVYMRTTDNGGIHMYNCNVWDGVHIYYWECR